MKRFSNLLNIDKSDLAWVLRVSLCGMQAQLRLAMEKYATDPGIKECKELLDELNLLLEPAFEPAFEPVARELEILETDTPLKNDSLPDDVFEPAIPVSSGGELKLIRLREAFVTDQKLAEYVGLVELNSSNDSDLWQEVQCLLLRVPEQEANRWRKLALDLANEVGGEKDKRSLIRLPFTKDEIVYPGLTGNLEAEGLCLSTQQKFDPRLTQEYLKGENQGDLLFLANVISLYIQFIELDPHLHHAFKRVDRFGVRCLKKDPEQKSRYIAAAIDRFQRAVTTEKNDDILEILRARLDLDEAIHSLVYVPPVNRYSWWGKLQQQCRDTLAYLSDRARKAGHQVQIRSLWGPYAEILSRSKDDLEVDSGGIPGEVSACLRVYANINEEVLPGRVLFRGQR